MADIITEIWKFPLRQGNSPDPREGACLLDAVSWFEYGTLGDHPACVCPVIAAFARGINDAMSDAPRQQLRAFIPRLVGTVDRAAEADRGEYLAWQAIRVFAPLALDIAGRHDNAAKLRNFVGSLSAAAAAAEAGAKAAEVRTWAAEAAWAAAGAAIWAATEAAEATARAAARAAEAAAETADWTARAAAEAAMIAALEGVLLIGKQAMPIPFTKIATANEQFAIAAGVAR